MVAAVRRNEILIGIGLGITVGAEKQHVLEKVCQAGRGVGIAAADVHVHGGGGLVGFRVADQQDLEAVIERQRPVVNIVGAGDGIDDLGHRVAGVRRLRDGEEKGMPSSQQPAPGWDEAR